MAIYTRCPHCDTYFRVTTQQLRASSGQVRCGRCHSLFDAFATLTSRLPPPDADDATAVAEQSAEAVELTLPVQEASPLVKSYEGLGAEDEADYASDLISSPELELADSPSVAASTQDAEPELQAVAAEPVVVPPASFSPPPAAAVRVAEPLSLPEDVFASTPVEPARQRRWLAANVVLLIALLGQILYLSPDILARLAPAWQPTLERACAVIRCSVLPARLPNQLFIESSDLQLLDPAQRNEVLLSAIIRNRAPARQAYPMIELTLTDARNQTTARRVFSPGEYLSLDQDTRAGIGPDHEQSLRLYLNTGNIAPAGYRLYLFFV